MVFRLNHPETFDGSIAWAAPTRSFGPDNQDPFRFAEKTLTSQIYEDHSLEAAMKIKTALSDLVSMDGELFGIPFLSNFRAYTDTCSILIR